MILLRLFWEFFKTGLFSIGGGLATLPFLYDISNKTHWFTYNDLTNMLAISESTPGPIGINMSTYVGFTISGIIGSILATIAIITPSIIIVIIISKCLNIFKESKYVQSAFYGIRPASTALIFAALISICKISFFNFSKYITLTNIINILNVKGLILAIALFFLMKHTKKHPVFYILTSAIIGIIFNF
ncbi:chromate transporter [Clostridium sp. MSJ-8]|uniref:chromate transporter n=1 Tax=Clostridium sp. MSJ-8 TaxID=2841510 RepID=UPI001C0F1C98|nr:chromate transporter [Clostridium sp. MSJ-8]MBU5488860.1 chromate transporter [Clostridium sp. MSJ-8]